MTAAPTPTAGKRAMWCGPHAIAFIAGLSYDDAYARCLRSTRRKTIRGMGPSEVLRVLRGLRIRLKPLPKTVPRTKGWSLSALPTLRNLRDWLKPNRYYLVWITRHYVIVDTTDWSMLDQSGWVPVDHSWVAGRRVVRWYEVRRVSD